MPQHNSIIAWDVGGAHLKAALLDAQGIALQVVQMPCPLWRGINELEQALAEVLRQFELIPNGHAVTMTGELVDIFANRHDGVLAIAKVMRDKLAGELQFYAGQHGLVAFEQVAEHSQQIASANWLASANFLAQSLPLALFVDVGSTTADFIVLAEGKAHPQGLNDAARLRSNELIYTGVVRTPLMALCHQISFEGHRHNIAAEYFATTADVYRLTGELSPADDMAETADSAGKSALASARRLARMVGHDVEYADIAVWQALAHAFRDVQIQRLLNAAELAFASNLLDAETPLVGAGAGRFLVAALAKKMNRRYLDVSDFIHAKSSDQKHLAGLCFPAYALAKIAQASPC